MKWRLLFVSLLLSATHVHVQTRAVRVSVADANGAVIRDAKVLIAKPGDRPHECSRTTGAFECDASSFPFRIWVEADGFEPTTREIAKPSDFQDEYKITLEVAPLSQNSVTVGIGRTESRLGDAAESIAVLGKRQLETTAAPTLDDALRQAPGFSIFRRSSSRNANPTTQGVSLRGVGASGASRSIVMLDGVPLNDPFGGWVQWNRVSPIAVESIEVLRGGASSLYGNSSLSGAIDLVSRTSDKFVFSGEAFGGSQRTLSGSMLAGGGYKGWDGSVSGGHFQTRGYIPIDEAERGLVDLFSGVRATNLSARIGRSFGESISIFFRPSYFGESRTNGTPAQINRTHSRTFVLGGRIDPVSWCFFGGTQVYDQTFSAVTADRNSESLTRLQRSPAQHFGFSGVASTVAGNHSIVAGIEGREVRGSSNEIGFANGQATSLLGAGGRERTLGLFAKDVVRIGERFLFTGGIRFDLWKNFRGLSVTRLLSGGSMTSISFPDRDESAFSPHASILIQVSEMFSIHASASRSFRAPTLNELYRGFRVGNVVTNANADLLAERATNAEGGVSFKKKGFIVRTTGFITIIDDAIANVTLSSTPSLITRQRQNAGETRTSGIEIDAETRLKRLELNVGFLFADSRVTEFPSNPALVDKMIPQVPRHQFTFQARYPVRRWTFAVQGRASSEQFDDDLNLFRLEPYFQIDAFVSKRIGEMLQIFGAVENVFNSRYSVGRTPVRTISSQLNARIGIRWN